MMPYRLKFILLWLLNLAVILPLSMITGFHDILLQLARSLTNITWLYLGIGALLALLEQALWDKLKSE